MLLGACEQKIKSYLEKGRCHLAAEKKVPFGSNDSDAGQYLNTKEI